MPRQFDLWYHQPARQGHMGYVSRRETVRNFIGCDDQGHYQYKEGTGNLISRDDFDAVVVIESVAHRNHLSGYIEHCPFAQERVSVMLSGIEFFSALKIQDITQPDIDNRRSLVLTGRWNFKVKGGTLFLSAIPRENLMALSPRSDQIHACL